MAERRMRRDAAVRLSRRRTLAVGASAVAAGLAGCVSEVPFVDDESPATHRMAGVDAARTGTTPVAVASAPSVAWRASLGAPVSATPVADADGVVVGDLDGVVHRLDIGDGSGVWHTTVGSAVRGAPAVGSDHVFAGDGRGRIRGLSRANGDRDWRIDDGDPVRTPLAVADGTAYLAAGDLLCALRSDGGEAWATEHRFLVEPSFALADGVVYAVGAGTLAALDARSGGGLWRADAASGSGLPAVAAGRVLVPGPDHVAAYDAGGDGRRWRTRLGDGVSDRLAVTDEAVLLAVADRALALAPDGGTVRWERPLDAPVAPPTVAGDLALFGTGGDLVALSVATGRERWRVALGGAIERPPAVTDRGVVVATTAGEVSCLR